MTQAHVGRPMRARRIGWMAGAILGVLAGCGPERTAGHRSAVAVELGAEARSPADQAAIRTGYLERLRLGLGSPFRLAEFALSDPRLAPETRRRVAREIVESTAEGDPYQIDPVVLVPSSVAGAEAMRQARGHLALVESTVAGAPDPRAGELTVRLAYRLAELERSTDPRMLSAAAAVASLVRDREFARRDARRILQSARRAGRDPVDLVAAWRRERLLLVERPPAQAAPSQIERQAIRAVPRVLSSIRYLGVAGGRSARPRAPEPGDTVRLARLRAIADSMDMPPRAPVVVALRQTGSALPEALDRSARLAWAEFAAEAMDEERFASRFGPLLEREPLLRTALAAAAVNAAVGMRPFAQEQVWYPGMAAPTMEQLRDRYGVRVRASAEVPERWVPFYLQGLDESIRDLKSVIPTLSVRGLTVEITRESGVSRALASHTPSTRVLQWPVTTGPGTLAHEIAHDLDWQVARRSDKRARRYASDRAPRVGPASFVSALALLTPSAAEPGVSEVRVAGHATRPAEVLARTFDWFLVTRLAARGRWNGALSSAQDDLFTGHGSLRSPVANPWYGPAVVEALRSLLPIPEAERSAFLSEYGHLRWPTANLMLGAVADRLERAEPAPIAVAGAPQRPFQTLASVRDEFFAAIGGSTCESRSPLVDHGLRDDYLQLVAMAATARGRAAALEMAVRVGGPEGGAWMRRELYGPLWPRPDLDADVGATLAAVADGVRSLEQMPAPLLADGFHLEAPGRPCPAPALQQWTVRPGS